MGSGCWFLTMGPARDRNCERTFEGLRDARNILMYLTSGRHRRLDPDQEEVVTLSRLLGDYLFCRLVSQHRCNIGWGRAAGVGALDLGGTGRVFDNCINALVFHGPPRAVARGNIVDKLQHSARDPSRGGKQPGEPRSKLAVLALINSD